jgi:hypothetical protein
MILRRHHREREGVMAMISPIAAAGMLAVAVPLLAPVSVQAAGQAAGQVDQPVLIVARAAGEARGNAIGKRVRRLIMAVLARRGHDVRDGGVAPFVPGATILRVATERRILQGTYITQASIGLRASLVDGDTRRFLARFDPGPGITWRLAAHCPQTCIDREVQRRIRPLAARLAADVDRRLTQLGRDRMVAAAARARVRVAFRRIDRTLLPRIEQYLRNFPGVTRIRRDDAAGQGVLYRLHHDGTASGTDLSLKKMLHHLRLKARIARTGNSYVVEADPAAQPVAGSQDW